MDQIIPHLVVQCGEQHVIPVCKGLISILTGTGSALCLPRYAFNTIPQDQVKCYFEVHKSWSQSLKPIQLTPRISHLDQQRTEYFDDGSIVKRSTREWALAFKNEDGTSAHCDVVNGGSADRQAILVCPQPYFDQAQHERRQYRSRLNPPSHREARYVESISGLTDLSNIRIEIETNVTLLDQLSSADIWKKAPPNVRNPSQALQASGSKTKKSKPTKNQPNSQRTKHI